MAASSAIYPRYKTSLLKSDTNVSLTLNDTTNGPYCALIDEGVYTYQSTHDFWDDASAGNVGVANGVVLTLPTVSESSNGGVFDADNITFSAVTGATVEALIVYRHNSGTATAWRLVSFLGTADVTGMPVTPNGGDITLTWAGTGIWVI